MTPEEYAVLIAQKTIQPSLPPYVSGGNKQIVEKLNLSAPK